MRSATPPFPPGPFDLILADPPWQFSTFSEKGQGKSPGRHYATMDVNALCRLPVQAIATEHSVLALWVYGPQLQQAFRVIEAWGFVYKSDLLVWVKKTSTGKPAFGTGYFTRKSAEQVLLATRGKGLRVVDRGVPQTIFARRREHSRKPDEAAHALERLFGDVRRIELFARERREGWAGWGDQFPLLDQSL